MFTRTCARLLPVLAGMLALPGEAAACLDFGDFCDQTMGWSGAALLNEAGVPTDGVLLFRLVEMNDPIFAPEKFELVVTQNGDPVAGAFEPVDLAEMLAWRPAQPLMPDTTYLVTGSIHNDVVDTSCLPVMVPLDFEFTTTSGPTPPLNPPDVLTKQEVVVDGEDRLDNVVCCDGAYAYQPDMGCGGAGPLTFDDGFCTLLDMSAELSVSVKVTPTGGLANLAVVAGLVVDGVPETPRYLGTTSLSFSTSLPTAHCIELTLRDLATGQTLTTPKTCHEADEPLGPRTLQPGAPVLAERCAGAPYTCEKMMYERAWDPEQCTAWPAGSSGTTGATPTTGEPETTSLDATTTAGEQALVEHGCACSTAAPTRATWFGLLLLGLLRRRRIA